MTGRVLAVIGAQYGSEGKGVVAAHLAKRFQYHVRVGGPNAGHTLRFQGQTFKMRTIPCGWVNQDATLIIGAGAVINPEVLKEELQAVGVVDPSVRERLYVDERAWCISEGDRQIEEGQLMQEHIGSTLEGVGSARIRRVMRNPELDGRFGTVAPKLGLSDLCHPETAAMLGVGKRMGVNVLLEGTQGSGLSLVHGHWPFVTSADTNAAQLLSDVGLPPSALDDVLLVARTFPIRVGGHSGPLRDETSWAALSERLGKQVEEFTTVTGRRRRVGMWDDVLFRKAVDRNGASKVALTFLDYLEPSMEGQTTFITDKAQAFIDHVESFGVKVCLVGTGGPEFNIIERRVV